MVIRHTAHHVEVGLDGVLPGLPRLDLVALNTKRAIDLPYRVGFEDAAPIADDPGWTAMFVQRGVQHHEVRGQILAGRDHTGQERATVVFEDGKHVDRFRVRELVLLDVAHIHRPILMAVAGGEGHRLGHVRERIGWTGQAQLAIERHDAPAGTGAQMNPHLSQGRMHPELPEIGVHLQAADDRHRRQVDFARRLMRGMRVVRHTGEALGEETMENLVDPRPSGLQVSRDRRDIPPIEVQVHHRQPPSSWLRHLGIGRVPAVDEAGQGVLR